MTTLRVPATLAGAYKGAGWAVAAVTMTADQFAALAQLLRMQDGPSLTAARLVLVDGMRYVEAAALAGISASGAHNAVTRMRHGLELAKAAAG